MGPKLLGGGASLLAAAFILALPSIFEGEPADEVEPIRFGPPPVARVADAIRVSAPPPTPAAAPGRSEPTPLAPAESPVATSTVGGSDQGPAGGGAGGGGANEPADGVSGAAEERTGAGGGARVGAPAASENDSRSEVGEGDEDDGETGAIEGAEPDDGEDDDEDEDDDGSEEMEGDD
jgi:hypothetical protein